ASRRSRRVSSAAITSAVASNSASRYEASDARPIGVAARISTTPSSQAERPRMVRHRLRGPARLATMTSMPIELPDGVYLHFCRRVRTTAGGRTRAVLMRARMLAEHSQVPSVITTYDPDPHYPETRAVL